MSEKYETQIEVLLERQAEALEEIARSHAQGSAFDALCVAMLDGTPSGYKRAMKAWFKGNNADNLSAAELTALVDKWYDITRVPWDGGVEYYQPDVTGVSNGTRYGDNVGMQCTPSTDTVANRDDYAGHPFFAVVDCNWVIDAETKDVQITAIDGVAGRFERYNPKVFVGVLQMNGYIYTVESAKTYRRGWTSTYKPYANIDAPFGVRFSDNKFHTWTVHGKYMAGLVNDTLTCCSGIPPRSRDISEDTLITRARKIGVGYSGGCMVDWSWLKLMAHIKYASLTLDGILQGCLNFNTTVYALVAEQGTRRLLVASGNVKNFPVGSRVLIGTRAGSDKSDRNPATAYSISGATGCKVVSCEEITLNDTKYTAINLDCEPFDSVANGASDTTTTYAATYLWDSGTADTVLGNDGSMVSCTSGVYPAKLQGIEFAVGAYEVMADCIMKLYQDESDAAVYWYEPYIVRDASKQATSVTNDYVATGIRCQQPASGQWRYIVKEGYNKGVFFPVNVVGGSSSMYHRDAFYQNSAAVGLREVLAFCSLNSGSSYGGCSALYGGYGLWTAWWNFAGRLSPNGCRGELTA